MRISIGLKLAGQLNVIRIIDADARLQRTRHGFLLRDRKQVRSSRDVTADFQDAGPFISAGLKTSRCRKGSRGSAIGWRLRAKNWRFSKIGFFELRRLSLTLGRQQRTDHQSNNDHRCVEDFHERHSTHLKCTSE